MRFFKFKKVNKKPFSIYNFEGVMFDSELIPHIEKAEKGDFDSLRLLSECFLYGDDTHPLRLYESGVKVKKSPEIARYYNQEVLEMIECGFSVAPHVYAHELSMRAGIEAESGDYEESKKYYLKAIKYMMKNVSPEEWDFNIFKLFRYTMYHFGIITTEQYEFKLIQ